MTPTVDHLDAKPPTRDASAFASPPCCCWGPPPQFQAHPLTQGGLTLPQLTRSCLGRLGCIRRFVHISVHPDCHPPGLHKEIAEPHGFSVPSPVGTTARLNRQGGLSEQMARVGNQHA